jgi:hypothetical protein
MSGLLEEYRVRDRKRGFAAKSARPPDGVSIGHWLDVPQEAEVTGDAGECAAASLTSSGEGRLGELAEEMYEERKRLELEALKAEMLGDP